MCSIDNSSLFDQEYKPKTDLVAEKDYIILPETAWDCLVDWYGIKDKKFIVVKRSYYFRVYQLHEKSNRSQTFHLHYESTIHDFYKALVTALKIATPITHVWLLSRSVQNDIFITESLLNSMSEMEIDPLMLSSESYLDEHLPANRKEVYNLAIKSMGQSIGQSIGQSGVRAQGLRGLKNLGNTYMYMEDINASNPLGLQGELAVSYAELIKSLWSPINIAMSPFMFKKTFEKFSSHFSGYEQQDSQEFLGFLLDGLHEDMNKITNKPYVEIPDFEDESQADEIADQFWEYHKARNDSIIVDLFQGQLKSKVICNHCKKVSLTFDPFMHLSLPIPITNCKLNITFIHYSTNQTKFTLYLNKDSIISDLYQEINKLENVEHFLITQFYQQKICKIFKQDESLADISLMDIIYVYELPCSPTNNDPWVFFPIYHFLIDQNGLHISSFGYPLILALDTSDKDIDLNALVLHHLQRYTKKDLKEQEGNPLFRLRVFNSKKPLDVKFPILELLKDIDLQTDQDPYTIQQGQGMIVQWSTDTAYDIFGSVPKKNSVVRAVNTDLWRKFDVLPTVHPRQEDITLTDCLKEFIKEEKLSKDDLWYCPRCELRQEVTKKFDLWRLPEVIVIHLKRFSQVRMWGNKVDAYVDFPISELDMTDYVIGPKDEPLIYDLYAIDNHYGGLGGGHYTACAQNPQNKNWYNFDDVSVNRLDLNKLKTNAAYLLFYQRRRRENEV
ncbi:hypothetical protein G6F56_006087 [Rhizopus delemar]|nr:hypothetical protein G6F56_006087 [Rhizopus delemar]